MDCVGDQDKKKCRIWSTITRWVQVLSSTFTVQESAQLNLFESFVMFSLVIFQCSLPFMTNLSRVKPESSSIPSPQLISSSTRPKLSTLEVRLCLLTIRMNLFKRCVRFYTGQIAPSWSLWPHLLALSVCVMIHDYFENSIFEISIFRIRILFSIKWNEPFALKEVQTTHPIDNWLHLALNLLIKTFIAAKFSVNHKLRAII